MIDLVAVRLELNDDEVKSNPFKFNVGVYVVPEPRTVLDGLIALDNVVVLLLKNLKDGEVLDYDNKAYEMLHRANCEWYNKNLMLYIKLSIV